MPFTYEHTGYATNEYVTKANGSGEATFPSHIKMIIDGAFDNCKNSLTSLIIPHTLYSFGNNFKECPNLKSVIFLNNHLRIMGNLDQSAFTRCYNLEVVVLPNFFYYKTDITKLNFIFSECHKVKLYTEKEWSEHLEREKHYKLVQDINVNLKQIQVVIEEQSRIIKEKEILEIKKKEEILKIEEQRRRNILEQNEKEQVCVSLYIILDEIYTKKLFKEIMLFISTTIENPNEIACWQLFIDSIEYKTNIDDTLYKDKYVDVLCDLEQELKRVSIDDQQINKILNKYWIFYEIKMTARRKNRDNKYLENGNVRYEKERLLRLEEKKIQTELIEYTKQKEDMVQSQLFKEDQIKKNQDETIK
jgi:hypothetical protein